MQVTQTSFTIAEYCKQMADYSIIVNKNYQRSEKVWPGPARSYLIDTILSGYPIPKLLLYQKTDIKTRHTIKEIVDGQQRSKAVFDFFNDDLKITGRSRWAGLRFSSLEEEDQHKFLSYSLSCDLFVGATEPEIRQVFQRLNSYQVLLNKQEQRHATYQGAFKWFIVAMTDRYSQALKEIGVFGDRQLVRMADAALLTEVLYAIEKGIESASDTKLDAFYKDHDESFDEQHSASLIDHVFGDIFNMPDLHGGSLMKSYQIYSLCLALSHVNFGPVSSLQKYWLVKGQRTIGIEKQVFRLSQLAAALADPENNEDFGAFIEASSKGTNRITQRETRFKWMCAALADMPNPS